MSTRKAIQPLDPIDLGGINARADELVTKEVLGYLNSININQSLLTDDDPLRDEYTRFLNDLNNAPIVLTNEDMDIGESDSYFDDIDFTGGITLESAGLDITKDSFISNRLWANGLFGSTILPPTFIDPSMFFMNNYYSTHSYAGLNGEKMEVVSHPHSYESNIISQMVDLAVR